MEYRIIFQPDRAMRTNRGRVFWGDAATWQLCANNLPGTCFLKIAVFKAYPLDTFQFTLGFHYFFNKF